MAVSPYPIPRSARITEILSGDGVSAIYGPFNFKIADIEDVSAWTRPAGAAGFSEAAVTIAKMAGLAFDNFTVTFAAPLPADTDFILAGARVPLREFAIANGGILDAGQLEAELSRISIVLQEVRRDIDRAVKPPLGEAGMTIIAGTAGQVFVQDDDPTVMKAADIAAGLAVVSPFMTALLANADDAADISALIGMAPVASIADLRALPLLSAGAQAFVAGYHAGSRKGGGWFVADASDVVSADNGGTIIVNAASGKRYKRQMSPLPSLEDFGAKNDGVTSDDAALDRAIATGLSFCFLPGSGYAFSAAHVMTAGGVKVHFLGGKALLKDAAARPFISIRNCSHVEFFSPHIIDQIGGNFALNVYGAFKVEMANGVSADMVGIKFHDMVLDGFKCSHWFGAVLHSDNLGVAGHVAAYNLIGLEIHNPTIITRAGCVPIPGVDGVSGAFAHSVLASYAFTLFGDAWQQEGASTGNGWIQKPVFTNLTIVGGSLKSAIWVGGAVSGLRMDGIAAGAMCAELIGINTGTQANLIQIYNHRYLYNDPNGVKNITANGGIAGPFNADFTGSINITISGVFVATYSIQGWNGAAWIDLLAGQTTTGIKSVDVLNYSQVRIIATAYTSGTITAAWTFLGDANSYRPKNCVIRNVTVDTVHSCCIYDVSSVGSLFENITCDGQRETFTGLNYGVVGGAPCAARLSNVKGRNFYFGINIVLPSRYGDTVLHNVDMETSIASASPLKLGGDRKATADAYGGVVFSGQSRAVCTGATSTAMQLITDGGAPMKRIGNISGSGLYLSSGYRDLALVDTSSSVTPIDRIELAGVTLAGACSNAMMNMASFDNPFICRDWTVDMAAIPAANPGFYIAGMLNVTVNGLLLKNKPSGTGYAFAGVSAGGRIQGVQFQNVAAARRVDPSGICRIAPTNVGNPGDVVQNLELGNVGAVNAALIRDWVYASDGTSDVWRARRDTVG